MSTSTGGGSEKVNWSVRLDPDDAARWDDLHHALRSETGRRTLTKAGLFRALCTLADDPVARDKLLTILIGAE